MEGAAVMEAQIRSVALYNVIVPLVKGLGGLCIVV